MAGPTIVPGGAQDRRRCTDRRMRVGDLFRDMRDGSMSVVKTCAMGGFGALLSAFLTQAKTRSLDWMDYVGFALAVTVISGAPLASHALGLMAPRLAGEAGKYAAPAPSPTPPPTPAAPG